MVFLVIWSLSSMLEKGLFMILSDDQDGLSMWTMQVSCEIAGILATMVLEGILGRRQCLILYCTMIMIVAMLVDMMEKSPKRLMDYDAKLMMLKACRLIISFFFGPIKSLIILFTLSVYPTSMRWGLKLNTIYIIRETIQTHCIWNVHRHLWDCGDSLSDLPGCHPKETWSRWYSQYSKCQ